MRAQNLQIPLDPKLLFAIRSNRLGMESVTHYIAQLCWGIFAENHDMLPMGADGTDVA
jgi:hypothetical protein